MKKLEIGVNIQQVKNVGLADIGLAQKLFIDYFTNLYQNQTPEMLGISGAVSAYLSKIWAKNEQALLAQQLKLVFCLSDQVVVGLAIYELCMSEHILLIRTLPINLTYKSQELAIRTAVLQELVMQHKAVRKIVIMVRKGNLAHNQLCVQGGFKLEPTLFEDLDVVQQQYDSSLYNAYKKLVDR